MIEYTVKVWTNGETVWSHNNAIHREDGPAVIRYGGKKEWWLNNYKYSSEDSWNVAVAMSKNANETKPKDPHDGKLVFVDGVKYKLELVEEVKPDITYYSLVYETTGLPAKHPSTGARYPVFKVKADAQAIIDKHVKQRKRKLKIYENKG